MRYLACSESAVITQSSPLWKRPYPRSNYKTRVGYMWGLLFKGRGKFREVDAFRCSYTGYPTIEVDYSIGPVIARLTELGCKTLYCCSGLKADHRGKTEVNGYIAFQKITPFARAALPTDMYADRCTNFCIRMNRGLSQGAIRSAWRQYLANLSP